MSNPNNIIILSLTALGIAVIGVIGALAIWGSPSNPMIATATGQIGTILVAMIGALVAFRVGADVKAAAVEATTAAKVATVEAVESKKASKANAVALVDVKDGVDTIHGIVNHQKDLLTAELAESRKTAEALTNEVAGLHAALIASREAPGSQVAQVLADAISVHPLDTPTPAADAAKAEQAQKPPTTTKPTRIVVPPIDEPRIGDKS